MQRDNCLKRCSLFIALVSSLHASEECCFPSSMPPATPLCVTIPCAGSGFSFNAAYTLWNARQEGLAVGLSNLYLSPTPANTAAPGTVLYPAWPARSGFKVGVDFFLEYDCWDLNCTYTWFWNKHNGFTPLSSVGTIAPTLFPSVFVDTVATAEGKWNNWFNRIDLDLGKAFYVGSYLALRPFLGLVGAFEKQQFVTGYSPDPLGYPFPLQESSQQKWWAIGPYTGIKSSFTCNDDRVNAFSFFLDGGLALTWGKYRTTNTTLIEGAGFLSKIHNCLWNVGPMFELALGARWQNFWCACEDNSAFLLQAAWETQVWFDHNQMALTSLQGMSNNYSMQGLTLKAQVTF